ncbi:MAG TPA: hypothetical protein VME20_09375 [Acidimicrobiales bacterium]|nr:hypothetical protein [Acidimicrobiales bacterium]
MTTWLLAVVRMPGAEPSGENSAPVPEGAPFFHFGRREALQVAVPALRRGVVY